MSCRPPPTAFTWYRNGTTIATEQNLTLRTITRQDSGTYRWVEEGGGGTYRWVEEGVGGTYRWVEEGGGNVQVGGGRRTEGESCRGVSTKYPPYRCTIVTNCPCHKSSPIDQKSLSDDNCFKIALCDPPKVRVGYYLLGWLFWAIVLE